MALVTVEHRPRGGNWWVGVLAGLLLGGLLALILAPETGQRFRARLLEGVDRVRGEVRGTERYGGGEAADPIAALRLRTQEALAEARRAYDVRRAELERELERDRQLAIAAPAGERAI